jgi:hypothetical protein
LIHGSTESYAVDDSRIITDGSDFFRASLDERISSRWFVHRFSIQDLLLHLSVRNAQLIFYKFLYFKDILIFREVVFSDKI